MSILLLQFQTIVTRMKIAAPSGHNNDINNLTRKDTSEIIQTILDSKLHPFNKLNKKDSIYIYKSEKVNKNWPLKSDHFKIGYIKLNKDIDIIDFGPTSFNDKRTRIAVPIFKLHNGTVNVSLNIYQFQDFSMYNYKLKLKDNGWRITEVKEQTHL